jgi:hypothetical protein
MKAQELRIGNWYNQFGNYHQVNWETIKELANAPEGQMWFKPIELTEEILLKCEGYFKNEFGVGVMYEPDYGNAFYLMKDGSIQDCHYDTPISNYRHIKHLHQLQNLYFALTGEELKITL